MSKILYQSIQEEFGDRASSSPMNASCTLAILGLCRPYWLIRCLYHARSDRAPENYRRSCESVTPLLGRKYPGYTTGRSNHRVIRCSVGRAGIVMDLNELKGMVALDKVGMTVTVKAATPWSDLESYLNAWGLACKSVPSSAPAATVGGWICMMGYGIGSLKYGSLISQVRTVEVVLPDGKVQRVTRTSDPSLDWFAASEGTLGIITEIELEIRALTSMKHFLLHVPDNRKGVQIISLLIGDKIRPYNIHFSDQYFVRGLKDLDLSDVSIDTGGLLVIDYEGSAEEVSEAGKFIEHLLKEHPSITIMSEALAELEWE